MAEGSTVVVKGGSRVGDSGEQDRGSQVSRDIPDHIGAASMTTTFSTDESSMASQMSSKVNSTGETTPRSAFKKDDEYTTQFFGFTTKSFCNGIYNAYNCLLLDVLETWSAFVHQQFSSKCGLTEEKMSAACENIRKALVSKLDKGFDRLELYMENNMFHVPKSIVLEEDKAHSLWDPSAEDEAEVDQEIEELTDKIQASSLSKAQKSAGRS
ncbi:uncharacterized protein LOC135479377 [Liolophura sinensis]|uniref:uncharacterized protein LOC135479377 n=1 Tax=Liolophura sinensis TaxID=3198878 RepID=UPI0031587136